MGSNASSAVPTPLGGVQLRFERSPVVVGQLPRKTPAGWSWRLSAQSVCHAARLRDVFKESKERLEILPD
jgi:hypothetical protein